MNTCPECGEFAIKEFKGEAVILKCNNCGYEKAIVPEEKTKQTNLW